MKLIRKLIRVVIRFFFKNEDKKSNEQWIRKNAEDKAVIKALRQIYNNEAFPEEAVLHTLEMALEWEGVYDLIMLYTQETDPVEKQATLNEIFIHVDEIKRAVS